MTPFCSSTAGASQDSDIDVEVMLRMSSAVGAASGAAGEGEYSGKHLSIEMYKLNRHIHTASGCTLHHNSMFAHLMV